MMPERDLLSPVTIFLSLFGGGFTLLTQVSASVNRYSAMSPELKDLFQLNLGVTLTLFAITLVIIHEKTKQSGGESHR